MNKKRIKQIAIVLSLVVAYNACFATVSATPTQNKLNETNKNINSINQQKNQTEQQVNALNSQVVELMASVNIAEANLKEKRKELAVVQADLATAQKKETDQSNAMKARIKSIYEKGNTAYLTAFLESKSLADLVNKVEYASNIYDFDKTMLDNLKESKRKVQELETQVAAEEAELAGMVQELKAEKSQLDSRLATLKKEIKDFDTQLANAKKQAETYQAQIEAENKRAREQANNGGGGNSGGGGGANVPYDGTKGSQIVQYACQFIGNPYVWGGNDLYNGIDCSGFTCAVYGHFGISLPRWSGDQRNVGTAVSLAEAKPGDLVCYSGHVAIYMGNNQIVHASNSAPYPAGGIKTSRATYTTILTIRRLV